MTPEAIKRRFSHLTTAELFAEIDARTRRPYDTRKAPADLCTLDADILRACREIIAERGAAAANHERRP